jgi:hypothetical protein
MDLIRKNYRFLKFKSLNFGIINRAAIDVFFAARVARQKCLRPSAQVCG